MAQLQHPPALLGELPPSWEVVDDHGLNAPRGLRRDGGQGLLPARSALLPRKQQGIEEGGVVAAAGLERRQVQDPRRCVELEPQTIGQEHERSTRNLLRAGAGDKPAQRPAEAIPIRRQRHARTLGEQLAEREAFHEHSAQDRRWRPMSRATALPRANRPRASALHALPTPWAKPSNPGTTTRGFRMLGVHACELLRTPCCGQRGNPPFARPESTEFLYPSPQCDWNDRPRSTRCDLSCSREADLRRCPCAATRSQLASSDRFPESGHLTWLRFLG